MPLTPKGRKIKANFIKEYGKDKGEEYFYRSINEGSIKGAEGTTKSKKRKKTK